MSNTRDQHPDAIPTALRGLWSEACDWIAFLVSAFAAHPLRTTGVRRMTAARLTIWLANIEGAVRRLILAAALALSLPKPRHTPARAAAHTRPQSPARRRPGFCVFRLHGGAATQRAAATARTPAQRSAHIAFPADPLLRLGATQASRRLLTHAPRARNPLDRHGRLSRHDPDWRPSPTDGEGMFAEPPTPQWRPPRASAPPPPRTPHTPDAMPSSAQDWRRCHDEWQRVIPAPTLATRLDALTRLIASPQAAIARAARRLHRAHNLGRSLVRDAAPRHRLPRRVRHIETAGHTGAFNDRCHDQLRIDSS